MQPDLEHSLVQMKASWMMGGSAQSAAPQSWNELAKVAQNAELSLLALSGQAIDLCFAASPSALSPRSDIPSLKLPTLPEEHRVSFRRALTSIGSNKDQTLALIGLMANRGYSSHPMDWMPSATVAAPDVYAPWQDWRASHQSKTGYEILTLEEWDAWMPAARLVQLKAMRRRDPSGALEMISAKAPSEPAEKRLALVDILWIGLSENDIDFLQSLSADRSGKVKARAQQLLARLGQSERDAESAGELADFLELTKSGFLSRKRQLKAKKLKTKTQYKRRAELFAAVNFSDLSRALTIPAEEMCEIWSLDEKDIPATTEFVQMVVDTGSEAAVTKLAGHLKTQKDLRAESLAALSSRLNRSGRTSLMKEMLKRPNDYFTQAVAAGKDNLGEIAFDDIKNTSGFKSMMSDLKAFAKDNDNRRTEYAIDQYVSNLSLLCNQDAAKTILAMCHKLELPTSTPRFSALTFNAALPLRANT